MIERASFEREYAVILTSVREYDPNDTPGSPIREVKHERWIIQHVVPKKMIWRWKPAGDGSEVLDIKPTEDVETHSVPISDDLAKALQEAWQNVLYLTRYGEDRRRDPDGTTLEFYCGGLFGEARSPGGRSLPRQMADLGRRLRVLALAQEKDREPLLKEVDGLARKIVKEAEAEQIRLFGKKMLDRVEQHPE